MKKVLMNFLAGLMLCMSIFPTHAVGLTDKYKQIFEQLAPEFPGFSDSSRVVYSLGAIEGWNNPAGSYGVTVFYNPLLESFVKNNLPNRGWYYDTSGIKGTAVAILLLDEQASFSAVSALARSEYFGPTDPPPTVFFPTAAIPEPSSFALGIAGLFVLLVMKRRKLSQN